MQRYTQRSSKGRRRRLKPYLGGRFSKNDLEPLNEVMSEDSTDETDTLDASYLSYDTEGFGLDDTTWGTETIGTTTLGETVTVLSDDESTMVDTTGSRTTTKSNDVGGGGGSTSEYKAFGEGASLGTTSTVTTRESDKLHHRIHFCGSISWNSMKTEVQGAFQDTVSSLYQVFHAFTLSEKDIQAVTKRIRKAKRQYGEY